MSYDSNGNNFPMPVILKAARDPRFYNSRWAGKSSNEATIVTMEANLSLVLDRVEQILEQLRVPDTWLRTQGVLNGFWEPRGRPRGQSESPKRAGGGSRHPVLFFVLLLLPEDACKIFHQKLKISIVRELRCRNDTGLEDHHRSISRVSFFTREPVSTSFHNHQVGRRTEEPSFR